MARSIIYLFFIANMGFAQAQQFTFTPINTGTQSSFRGLSVVDNSVVWVSGSQGWFGRSMDGGKSWAFNQIKGYEQYDFRSLYAFDASTALLANAGSPAYILKTVDGGKTWKEVYKNEDKNAFIDGIDGWNDKEGIVFGDPIDSRMLVLHTVDSGEHWTENARLSRPELKEGEASFAASGTTIRCIGKTNAIIATGGKVSQLWLSSNKGESWKPQSTPIVQGVSSQGIFSVAFKSDLKNGVIVGGDFQQDTVKRAHVFYTFNGGVNWNFPTSPTRGYRECVEYVTENTVIATGPSGTDISYDGGVTWKGLSDEKSFHVIRKARNGKLIVMAGGQGRVSVVRLGN